MVDVKRFFLRAVADIGGRRRCGGRYALACLCSGLFALAALPVSAVEVPGLFEVELIVGSEAAADRDIALRQALYVVLDRIMVADDISRLPPAQQMLRDAGHYVQQIQYLPLPDSDNAATDVRQLRVRFDEDEIYRQLRKNHIGIWSEIRPHTLLWLVIDDGGGSRFYDAENMPDVAGALTLVASIKALPLMFPLLDLDERQKLPLTAVVADDERLLAASARYEVPAVLAGQLTRTGNCWQSRWRLYFDGKTSNWSHVCQPLKQTLALGINGTYGVLAAYYGVKPDMSGGAQP